MARGGRAHHRERFAKVAAAQATPAAQVAQATQATQAAQTTQAAQATHGATWTAATARGGDGGRRGANKHVCARKGRAHAQHGCYCMGKDPALPNQGFECSCLIRLSGTQQP